MAATTIYETHTELLNDNRSPADKTYMVPTNTKYYISELAEQVGSLPSLAGQIAAFASDSGCDLQSLAKLILSDNVMTMRFLALANSPAVSRGQEISDLRGALVRLGLRRVRNVALLMGIHDMLPSHEGNGDFDLEEFWQYNLAVASCAQGLAWQQGTIESEEAWLVGILHGVGLVILHQNAPRDIQAALKAAAEQKISLSRAETEIFGFHHGELGGMIFRNWNIPDHLADTVEAYPDDSTDEDLTGKSRALVTVLRQAIAVARAIGFENNGDGTEITPLDSIASQAGLPEAAVEALAVKVDRNFAEVARLIGLEPERDMFTKAWAATKEQVIHLGLMGFDDSLACQNLENEIAAARNIQQRLLPSELPVAPGFSFAAGNIPCHQVSGDTYDFLKLPDGCHGLVVADVAGKGMPASLLASNLQASIRALSKAISDPAELLAAVNMALFESTDPELFATLFLGCLDQRTGTLRYVSAGHNPPLLLHPDHSAEWLQSTGLPLGIVPEADYSTVEIRFEPGDLLTIYTDGITEAIDDNEVEFAEEGLLDVVTRNRSRGPEAIVHCTFQSVLNHVGSPILDHPESDLATSAKNSPPVLVADDDLTMIVVHKTSPTG